MMNWKRESLALVFGMLIVPIIFGDTLQGNRAGNLDTVFGQTYGHLMDVIYPFASIVVFLLYGKSKGGIQIHIASILLFLAFLAGLSIIQFDDFFVLLNHPITLPWVWWTTARWCYLFISTGSFFAFGWVSGKLKSRQGNATLLD
jgi:hypothetical protein